LVQTALFKKQPRKPGFSRKNKSHSGESFKMFKRLKNAGVNLVVIAVAIAVAAIAFVAAISLGNASRPETIEVLVTNRNLNIGDTIAVADLKTIVVYKDQLASQYITADQANQVIGGYTALPIYADQPITRTSVIAAAGAGTRLSAVLSQYPGYSLFPLPIDAQNVVASDLGSYMPGDLVSITVVIASRPQPPITPTPMISAYGYIVTPTPMAAAAPAESALDSALTAVEGLPVVVTSDTSTTSSSNTNSSASSMSYTNYNLPKRLILLVPSGSVESLALSLQAGDMVVVSMITQGQEATTPGFSYWDLEDLIKIEREKSLK
jgi:Flp pilus assembly protein CpaB